MPTDIIRLDEGWCFDAGLRMDEPPPVILPVTPPVHHKKGSKVMTQDYVPKPRDSRRVWYENLSLNVVAEAVKFGGAATDATAIKGVADDIIAKMKATKAAEEALDAARKLEVATEKTGLAQIRAKIKSWKTLTGWPASGSESVLQVAAGSTPFDPDSYHASLTATAEPGGVRLDFTKKGVEGMAIYLVKGTTGDMVKVGSCNHSPFYDHTPLALANVPERRQYMARGLVNDREVGEFSDAVNVTFAG